MKLNVLHKQLITAHNLITVQKTEQNKKPLKSDDNKQEVLHTLLRSSL